ncbi:MAG TPA: DUF6458 family protein [Solirubrobacteraceae bacterium]|nr:DUF6458 family protein [Solirubrobacteraceae bacterium]
MQRPPPCRSQRVTPTTTAWSTWPTGHRREASTSARTRGAFRHGQLCRYGIPNAWRIQSTLLRPLSSRADVHSSRPAWARRTGEMTSAMAIGTSIFLIAVGAVLKFAVTATVSGISLATVGTILIVLGVIGLLISLVFVLQAGRRDAVVTRERVVEPDPYV